MQIKISVNNNNSYRNILYIFFQIFSSVFFLSHKTCVSNFFPFRYHRKTLFTLMYVYTNQFSHSLLVILQNINVIKF